MADLEKVKKQKMIPILTKAGGRNLISIKLILMIAIPTEMGLSIESAKVKNKLLSMITKSFENLLITTEGV